MSCPGAAGLALASGAKRGTVTGRDSGDPTRGRTMKLEVSGANRVCCAAGKGSGGESVGVLALGRGSMPCPSAAGVGLDGRAKRCAVAGRDSGDPTGPGR
jgi:hypothetical protein